MSGLWNKVGGGCAGRAESDGGEGAKRQEEDRGWASARNKLRMRIVARKSWHGAIHSVAAPRRTGVRCGGEAGRHKKNT